MSAQDPREDELSVLAERARQLARPRIDARQDDTPKYALFERHRQRYAIEPQYVFAVARAPEPTPLPNAAPYWSGVSSVHGELLPVVELSALLDQSAPVAEPGPLSETPNSCLLLVLGRERREFGVTIDALLDANALGSELVPTPYGDPSAQLVAGSAHDGTRVVRGDALLGDPRLFLQANQFTEA